MAIYTFAGCSGAEQQNAMHKYAALTTTGIPLTGGHVWRCSRERLWCHVTAARAFRGVMEKRKLSTNVGGHSRIARSMEEVT